MKLTWTIIGVGDVPASLKWYQALFGLPATLPAHDYFGQILDPDGTLLVCLHEWGAHEHPSLMTPDHGTPGNGLIIRRSQVQILAGPPKLQTLDALPP
jgi:catechol 2,3-dioxygenase-like lactoylglutathione lyase family enzyme